MNYTENSTQMCNACWVLYRLSAMKSETDSPVAAPTEVVVVGFGATTRLSTKVVQHSSAACVMVYAVGFGATTRLITKVVQHSSAACVMVYAVGFGATTRMSSTKIQPSTATSIKSRVVPPAAWNTVTAIQQTRITGLYIYIYIYIYNYIYSTL